MLNITVLSRPFWVESKHYQESLVRDKESKVKGGTNREVKTHESVTTSALCFNFMVFIIIIITILEKFGKSALQPAAHKQVHKLEKYRNGYK